jgi:hypothetical protein
MRVSVHAVRELEELVQQLRFLGEIYFRRRLKPLQTFFCNEIEKKYYTLAGFLLKTIW